MTVSVDQVCATKRHSIHGTSPHNLATGSRQNIAGNASCFKDLETASGSVSTHVPGEPVVLPSFFLVSITARAATLVQHGI